MYIYKCGYALVKMKLVVGPTECVWVCMCVTFYLFLSHQPEFLARPCQFHIIKFCSRQHDQYWLSAMSTGPNCWCHTLLPSLVYLDDELAFDSCGHTHHIWDSRFHLSMVLLIRCSDSWLWPLGALSACPLPVTHLPLLSVCTFGHTHFVATKDVPGSFPKFLALGL